MGVVLTGGCCQCGRRFGFTAPNHKLLGRRMERAGWHEHRDPWSAGTLHHCPECFEPWNVIDHAEEAA